MKQKLTAILAVFFLIIVVTATVYYGFLVDEEGASRQKWAQYNGEVKTIEQQLKSTMNQIQLVQGSSTCSNSSQCRAIGIGSKTCNEFREYLIYSIKDSNEAMLLKLVEEFNTLHEKKHNLSIAISQCGSKAAPTMCVDGRCVPRVN